MTNRLDLSSLKIPQPFDLKNPGDELHINSLAESIVKGCQDLEDINQLEIKSIRTTETIPLAYSLAIKLAKSKLIVSSISSPLRVSIVFAVYKEHNRIKTLGEHPHGEDFLRRKVKQLKDLFGQNPNITWKLFVVDDGCPEHSGELAQTIVENENFHDVVEVLFLKNAIENNMDPVSDIDSTSNSQKGGSIAYGMRHAALHHSNDRHIILFTDADLSTHLGQIGLIIDPILYHGYSAAIGSRREFDSVVLKNSSRNVRGKLFIYLWKRLLPQLGYIVDTQCGFKAFDSGNVLAITDALVEKKFAIDIELLLKTEIRRKNSIKKIGIAWIDSVEASTTTDIQPYLPMLKSVVKLYRTYLPKNNQSELFASFIEELSENSFEKLLSNIPDAIANKDPFEFGEFDGIGVEDLKINAN